MKPIQADRCLAPLRLTKLAGSDRQSQGERPAYGVTFVKAGYVRLRNGDESAFFIPPAVLQAAVPLFNGLASLIDHAGLATLFYPSLRDTAGVTFNPLWNGAEASIEGGIRLSNRPDLAWFRFFLREYWEDQAAGREVPDIGLSAVLFSEKERVTVEGREELHLARIKKAESVDFVFGPGAEGRLREAFHSAGRQAPGVRSSNNKHFTIGGNTMNNKTSSVGHTSRSQTEFGSENNTIPGSQTEFGNQPISPPMGGTGGGGANLQTLFSHLEALTERVDQLAGLPATVERLTTSLAHNEEANVVEGLGQAPHDPAARPGQRWGGMQTGLDRFSPVVDWLFGVEGAALPDPQFRRADLIYTALTGDWEFTGLFDGERVALAGASPVTLPNLAVNAMNKVIVTQFSKLRYWRWYERVAVVVPNDGSLHDMQWITYGGSGNLPVVEDGAPYTEGQLADSKESNSFEKRGRYIGITRKMIKNSDIQRIQAVPIALATDALRTRSAKIAAIFTDNAGVGPTLSDGNALFHASRNNVDTTAFGTDTTAWEAASQECFGHTELGSGQKLALYAKYALVPNDLYFQALKNFGYGDGNPTTYNPFAVEDRSPEDPRPVVLPVPDWTDSNDWAYLADPNIWPVIMMSYSQNPVNGQHPLPELFAVTSETGGLMFTNDTLPVKVRDEWAAGVNGGRGIGKRNVA